MRLIIVLLLSLLLLSQADVKRTKKELRRIERLREDSEVDTCPKGCLDLSKLDILVFDDIFPTKLADQIIQKFEEDERAVCRINQDINEVREGKVLSLGKDLPEWEKLELRINKVVEKVVRELVKEYEITKWFAFSDTGYDVVKYDPEEVCKNHVDWIYKDPNGPEYPHQLIRAFSVVMYLNDVAEGGESYFTRQKVAVAPKKGRIVVYPPTPTHPHEVFPPVSNSRYVVTTWLQWMKKPSKWQEMDEDVYEEDL